VLFRSLLPKAVMAIITRHEPGSGYQVINPNLTVPEQAAQAGMVLIDSGGFPFIGQDIKNQAERYLFPEIVPEQGSSQAHIPFTPIPAGLPAVKGDSLTRATDAYGKALADHREDIADFILDQAEKNHIPSGLVKLMYRRRMNSRTRTEAGPRNRYDIYGTEIPSLPR
jgi:hypothetical protein